MELERALRELREALDYAIQIAHDESNSDAFVSLENMGLELDCICLT